MIKQTKNHFMNMSNVLEIVEKFYNLQNIYQNEFFFSYWCQRGRGILYYSHEIEKSQREVARDNIFHSCKRSLKRRHLHAMLKILVQISSWSKHPIRPGKGPEGAHHSGLAVAQETCGHLILPELGRACGHAEGVHRPDGIQAVVLESTHVSVVATNPP